MKTKDIFILLESKVNEKLEAKTNWGRNDIKKLFQESIKETLFDLIDKE